MLLGGPGEEAAAEADIANMGLAPLAPDEAAARVPIVQRAHVTRAGWHDDALDIDTDRMVQVFARTIRAASGEVRTRAPVEAIARDGAVWRVTAHGETCEARVLVNAAGAWADRVAQMAGIAPLGLRPLRRSVARMPAPGGHDVSGWPMLLGAGETWYAKPDAGAWIVSPAEEDPVDAPHDAFADDMVLAEGIARYQPFVTEEVTRVSGSWAGLRTFAPDRCLVLGPEPGREDFVWVAGQGGYGFQTAPAASRLVADLVAGRPPELPADIVAALRPDRLRRGGISAA
jgi:glycine/D-amino acid oxidase-like deaminating enzyme